MSKTKAFDMDAYVERISNGPCFICEMLGGNPQYPNHIIYEDDQAVVFLNKYPTLYGHTLGSPRSIASK